jgi:hypothetical protein
MFFSFVGSFSMISQDERKECYIFGFDTSVLPYVLSFIVTMFVKIMCLKMLTKKFA